MSAISAQLRRALRRLGRSPGFAATVVICLALGIGVTGTILGLINGLFFRPLAGVEKPGDLVTLVVEGASSFPNYTDLKESTRTLTDMAAFVDRLLTFEARGEPEQVLGLAVSANYFSALGTRPAVGRLFLAGEDAEPDAAPLAVLSHDLWERRFASDSSVVGRTVRINGHPVQIVGVAPKGFVGTFRGFGFDIWLPLPAAASIVPGLEPEERGAGRLQLFARRRADLDAVGAELRTIGTRLRRAYPESNTGLLISAKRYTRFDPDLFEAALMLSGILLGFSLLILLIASANVANMLLARGLSRSRENAIRLALGSGRLRIVAVNLGDSVVLALLAGTLGLGIAELGARWLQSLVSHFPARLSLEIGPDLRVAAVAFLLSGAVGLAAGAMPALRISGQDLERALREGRVGARRRTRARRLSVMAQVALAAVLLVSAGLFLRTLAAVGHTDPGFDIESVQVAPFINVANVVDDEQDAIRLYERMLERASALPGVESAAFVGNVPLAFTGRSTTELSFTGIKTPPGRQGFEVSFTAVSPAYFAVMGIRLRGRGFSRGDRRDTPAVAVINAAMADRFWSGEEAIGKRFQRAGTQIEVVGVAANSRFRTLSETIEPFVYFPYTQSPDPRMNMVIQPAGPSAPISAPLREALKDLAPELPPPDVQPLDRFLALSLLPQRLAARVSTTLGVLGLLLAGLGIFGVVSFSVSQRIREMGIRMALGARRVSITRLVIGDGLGLVLGGLLMGIPLAFAATELIQGMLFGVATTDPLTYLAVTLIVSIMAVLGSWMPARRATRVDPVVALRSDL